MQRLKIRQLTNLTTVEMKRYPQDMTVNTCLLGFLGKTPMDAFSRPRKERQILNWTPQKHGWASSAFQLWKILFLLLGTKYANIYSRSHRWMSTWSESEHFISQRNGERRRWMEATAVHLHRGQLTSMQTTKHNYILKQTVQPWTRCKINEY